METSQPHHHDRADEEPTLGAQLRSHLDDLFAQADEAYAREHPAPEGAVPDGVHQLTRYVRGDKNERLVVTRMPHDNYSVARMYDDDEPTDGGIWQRTVTPSGGVVRSDAEEVTRDAVTDLLRDARQSSDTPLSLMERIRRFGHDAAVTRPGPRGPRPGAVRAEAAAAAAMAAFAAEHRAESAESAEAEPTPSRRLQSRLAGYFEGLSPAENTVKLYINGRKGDFVVVTKRPDGGYSIETTLEGSAAKWERDEIPGSQSTTSVTADGRVIRQMRNRTKEPEQVEDATNDDWAALLDNRLAYGLSKPDKLLAATSRFGRPSGRQ
jgi:hypothetical protein